MHERVIVITLDSEFLLDREVMDLVQLQQLQQHWVRKNLDGVVYLYVHFCILQSPSLVQELWSEISTL